MADKEKATTGPEEDERRLGSLMAPFRPRESNPIDWDSKMAYWSRALDNYCLASASPLLPTSDLDKELRKGGKTPQCLHTVIQHRLRLGELKRKEDLLREAERLERSWGEWLVDSLVTTPLVWSLSKLKEALQSAPQPTQYVSVNFLKVKGEEVLEKVRSRGEAVVSFEGVKEMVGGDGESTRLVIAWLELEGKARAGGGHAATSPHQLSLVKFSLSPGSKVEALSEADLARQSLLRTSATLLAGLQALESQKQQALDEARDNLAKGLRHSAKRCLRKKKELEKCIEKRGAALDNTEILLARIKEAESDAKVVEAYKAGVSALRGTFTEAGISEESVLSAVTQVQDMVEEHQEIQTALSEGVELGGPSEQELEDELAALLAADPSPAPQQEDLFMGLPELPQGELVRSPPQPERRKQLEPAL